MITAEEISGFVQTGQTVSTTAKWGCSVLVGASSVALAVLQLSPAAQCEPTTGDSVSVGCFVGGMQQNAVFSIFVGSCVLSLAALPWVYVAHRTLPPTHKTTEFSETTASFVRNLAMLAYMHQLSNNESSDNNNDETTNEHEHDKTKKS